MQAHDYEIAKNVAKKALRFTIDYANAGHMVVYIMGQKYEFPHKTDAEVMQEVAKIWGNINECLFEVINHEILAFVTKNKANFN